MREAPVPPGAREVQELGHGWKSFRVRVPGQSQEVVGISQPETVRIVERDRQVYAPPASPVYVPSGPAVVVDHAPPVVVHRSAPTVIVNRAPRVVNVSAPVIVNRPAPIWRADPKPAASGSSTFRMSTGGGRRR
jgi:hypothetical protein